MGMQPFVEELVSHGRYLLRVSELGRLKTQKSRDDWQRFATQLYNCDGRKISDGEGCSIMRVLVAMYLSDHTRRHVIEECAMESMVAVAQLDPDRQVAYRHRDFEWVTTWHRHWTPESWLRHMVYSGNADPKYMLCGLKPVLFQLVNGTGPLLHDSPYVTRLRMTVILETCVVYASLFI